jgi:hypothetical protein
MKIHYNKLPTFEKLQDPTWKMKGTIHHHHHHHHPETLFVNLQMQTILKLSFCKLGFRNHMFISHTKLSSSRERHTHTYTIAQREIQRERSFCRSLQKEEQRKQVWFGSWDHKGL